MNCANHPDRERAAFCQNCGKPLCHECIRNVGNSVLCEPCLVARTGSGMPPSGYGYPAAGYPVAGAPVAPSQPNPGLAALLGFIPGVGAMYNEQYGKGIVHLIVFAILVSLADNVNGIFGLFVAGWVFYMAIEAHHTARARRDGTPLPNPFGLNDISERFGFGKAWPGNGPGVHPVAGGVDSGIPNPAAPPAAGYAPPAAGYAPYSYPYTPPVANWGAPQEAYGIPPVPPVPPMPPMAAYPDSNQPFYRRLPTGAIWLIVLGLFFLFGNHGIFHLFPGRLFGPFVLIGVGVWIFVRKMTATGQGLENDGTAQYHWRLGNAIRGSFWILLTGIIFLLDVLHIVSWGHAWPLYVIGAGVFVLLKHTGFGGYGYAPPPYPVAATPPATPPVAATGLVPRDSSHHPGNGQEGR